MMSFSEESAINGRDQDNGNVKNKINNRSSRSLITILRNI